MSTLWPELPLEVLDLILQRLALPDGFTFGNVCQSWRSVFLDRRGRSRPPPCLMLGFRKSEDRSLNVSLCNLHEGKLEKLGTPIIDIRLDETIVGSFMGWLVITSSSRTEVPTYQHKIRVFNPISNNEITLPSIMCALVYRVALSSDPTTNDCIFVLNGNRHKISFLAWYIKGEDSWTFWDPVFNYPSMHAMDEYFDFDLKYPSVIVQDMVFHNGKLYLLIGGGDVLVYSLDRHPKMMDISSTPNDANSSTPENEERNWITSRLIKCGGDLLFLGWQFNGVLENFIPEEIYGWHVFKLVEEENAWVRVENIDDNVLLVGCMFAQSFPAQDLMGSGFEANCIYFYPWAMQFHRWPIRGLIKYSILDRCCRVINSPLGPDIDSIYAEWIVSHTW